MPRADWDRNARAFAGIARAVLCLNNVAIAAVLSDMDDEISALERHREKTEAVKQGMMQELTDRAGSPGGSKITGRDMVGQYERSTQGCVVEFFQDSLGYAYLGNWQWREENENVDDGLLRDWLKHQGRMTTTSSKRRYSS